MKRLRSAFALVAATCITLAAAALPAVAADPTPAPKKMFTIDDSRIKESSGLAKSQKFDDLYWTVNDSSDSARIFGIDTDGDVKAVLKFKAEVRDVEAIAVDREGTIYIADIGDNTKTRDMVEIYTIPEPDSLESADNVRYHRYDFKYPDGAHDAETLLVQPRTQRVFVVSKTVFGGTVYAAPRQLSTDRTNRLRSFARVGGLVTDGTFFPDGRHVLLRTYGTATIYTFPGFRPTGTVRLPPQPQGEGISVSATGRVLVSSEGVHADVLRIRLPARLTAPHAPVSTDGPSPATTPPDATDAGLHARPRTTADWVGIGAVALGVAAAVYLVLRAAPRRGRRRP